MLTQQYFNNNRLSLRATCNNGRVRVRTFTEPSNTVDFMDLTISIVDGKIETTIFEKSQNLYLYKQMGWVESPPYFCAASETGRDVAEQYAELPLGTQESHKLE